jgi:hypothetical protein
MENNGNGHTNGNGKDNGLTSIKELVYLFLYNPMIYMSTWTTQSVHKKRKTAEESMEFHRSEAYKKWEEDFPTTQERQEHPFGKYEDWRINAMVLES